MPNPPAHPHPAPPSTAGARSPDLSSPATAMRAGTVPDETPCPCCKGTGRVALTGKYADTLAVLRTLREPANGATLARLVDGCKPTAMNNRLVALERLGFAMARQYGRQRLWTAIAPAESHGVQSRCNQEVQS